MKTEKWNKENLRKFLLEQKERNSESFFSIQVKANLIDGEVVSLCQDLFCSLDIFFHAQNFEKKLFSKKAALLNNAELVFGFLADFAVSPLDSIKFFRERIDFACSLYPNHIEFPQFDSSEKMEKRTATFSSQDINYARDVAFAAEIFYSQGRAVPYFNSVLKPLKIPASKFFSDFAEWQRCNNCGFEMRQKIRQSAHKEIEKMQLLFLEEKYEEKKAKHLFPAARDLVFLHGAFSRLEGEGEECTLDLSFNPDDLLSPAALDLAAFSENVCMENVRVKIFAGRYGPEYRVV